VGSFLRYLLLGSLLLSQASWAGGGDDCVTIQSGAWEDPSIWDFCSGGIPIDDTFVTINENHVVTLNGFSGLLNAFNMTADSELIIADVVGGITMTTEDAAFDSSLGTITLNGDLTINGFGVNVFLGTIDGAAGLTIISGFETRFNGTIGVNTPLTSLITDLPGTLIFANADAGINTPNIFVNGLREFNDPITLERGTTISGSGAPLIFNNTINGSKIFTLSQINNTSIEFNADVGATTPLSDFRIFNSTNTTAMLNMDVFNTNGLQIWDVDMVIDAPSQLLVLTNSRISKDISVANGHWVRGITAGTQSLNVNSARDSMILGVVGDGSLPLLDLNMTAQGNIVLNTSSITVTDNMIFNSPIVLASDIELVAPVFTTVQTVNNGGFDLTLNIASFGSFNADVSGSGDFIMNGSGVVLNSAVTSMTGNVFINAGFARDNTSSDNQFPFAPVITLVKPANIGDGGFGDFILSNGQILAGTGFCSCNLITSPGSVVSPGFSSSGLFVRTLEMNTSSSLDIELNGTVPGLEYDFLSVQAANLDVGMNGGATLNISLGFVPSIGDEFIVLNVTTGADIIGSFNGLAEGDHVTFGSFIFSISYKGGDGNDVILTVIRNVRYHVDINAVDTGSNDGLTWDSAFLTLQDALAVVLENEDIWVAAGTYYPDEGGTQIDNDEFSTFTLKPGVGIYGGFIGDETDLQARAPYVNLTILSGDIDGNDINIDGNDVAETVDDIAGLNAFQILNGVAIDAYAVLDGFTVTAGNAVDKTIDSGAGMFCNFGVAGPSINQVMFIGNYASVRGAATYGCAQQVSNTQYINNKSDLRAGAVYTSGGFMESVVFEGNFTSGNAGALYNLNSPLTLINAAFIGNANGNGFGGAIRSEHELNIESSLFSGNRSVLGGAISMNGSEDLSLVNVTMTGNRATSIGGAIFSDSSGALNIVNSVIWNNQDPSGVGTADASIVNVNPTLTNSYSLIQGYGINGTVNLDTDPLFDTETNPSNAPTTVGNARPTIGSPILNMGNNTAVGMGVTDLDGGIRILETNVDMGAYEFIRPDLIFRNGFD
jgi:hypothetical protein